MHQQRRGRVIPCRRVPDGVDAEPDGGRRHGRRRGRVRHHDRDRAREGERVDVQEPVPAPADGVAA